MTNLFSRLYLSGLVFTFLAGMIIMQMVQIQSSPEARLLGKASGERWRYDRQVIYPERGNIYDRRGHLLAGNKNVYEIGVSLSQVENEETIAETVSIVLGLNYYQAKEESIRQALEKYKYLSRENITYIVLSGFVDEDKKNKLEEIKRNYAEQASALRSTEKVPSLRGLVWKQHYQRTYPEHTLASNILGFYSFRDREFGRGYYGIEEKYDDLLSGVPQEIWVPLDPNEDFKIPEVAPGQSLILTIDREIQSSVERIMDKAISDNGAKSGTAIVLDPRNGEILAMTTTPRLDLNEYWKYTELFPPPLPFNRAIGQTYEPGSIFKVLTMSAAIDSGTVVPQTQFVDTGSITVGGVPLHNWDYGAWGPQDMGGCMQHSLNVCLAWVATQMGPDTFYDYLQRFGIHRRTNIDLAGEVNWPLATNKGGGNWWEVNLGTNSYGQGVAVTPIQIVMATSAVANDGKMYAPHLLKAVINKGRQYNNVSQIVNTPISAETAHIMNEMLAVSLEQEASSALVPGYRVAGKTGTASIPDSEKGGYRTDVTNASFIGWGPVDDPRFVVYVWLEEPTSSPWGSVVAAPVFSEIAQQLVVLMNLPPDGIRLAQN